MNRFALVAAFAVLSLFGCKGCDDTAGQTNNTSNNTTQTACEDRDGDGWAAGLTCDGPVDCDDSDPNINPDTIEVCGDDVDNNCDGTVNEDCVSCDTEGATQPCGSDEGRCTTGMQTCRNGEWSNCDGSQGPFSETCNGEDDDCDGEIDEGGDIICNDGLKCNGVEVCDAGECVAGAAVDCSEFDGPCADGVCSEKDGGCKAAPKENGSECEDGNFCTVTGVCSLGVCETTPRDCSAAGDACNSGVCDEAADACVQQPVSDGTTCDDGAFCTINDTCTAGTCGGGQRDCSAAADQCNAGVCDDTTDSCVPQPVADDTACDDGLYCNVDETCQAGVCVGGTARSCGASGGSCREGVCDEATDTCDGDPVPDGTTCEDGQFCTTGDSCVAGSCMGGGARDCSSADGVCKIGACSEMLNQCVPTNAPDASACDDGQFCTAGDACLSGSCVGSARDCSASSDACNTGSCSEATDTCVTQPVSDGTACPDSLFCTVSELCQAGSCNTSPRDCSPNADQCNDSVCDDTADACTPQALPNNTMCDDGNFCTDGDTCQSGACLGGGPLDCDPIVGGNCLITSCNAAAQMCEAVNDPVCCDVMTDSDLDGYNECDDCDDSNGAINPAATEVCNGADDDCDGAIDEDFDGDGDGYATCTTDPFLRDCDDANPNVNPGMAESCDDGMGGNTGNGIDDDCDGYVDEGCNPCTTTDVDGDGWSECDGDCNDDNDEIYPTSPEICDGFDNDCNVFTVQNCGVSETCNWDVDGDGDATNDADQCSDDMLCACLLQGRNCTGDYRCTSFCNSSDTGVLGDGCQPNQACGLDLLYSANVHGCNVNTDTPGTLRGGEDCSNDSQCRSLNCEKLCRGPGPICGRTICQDLCTNDDECGSSAVCRISTIAASIQSGGQMDGRCWPPGEVFLGDTPVGDTCAADGDCDHGKCLTDPNTGDSYCTEACCTDSNCPSGYTCSYGGDAENANVYYDDPNGTRWDIVETTGQCIKDVGGQGTRRAGQVCNANSDCASNFCEANLGVCVDPCCADSTCPVGLTCELQFVETAGGNATQARVCVNISTEEVFERQ